MKRIKITLMAVLMSMAALSVMTVNGGKTPFSQVIEFIDLGQLRKARVLTEKCIFDKKVSDLAVEKMLLALEPEVDKAWESIQSIQSIQKNTSLGELVTESLRNIKVEGKIIGGDYYHFSRNYTINVNGKKKDLCHSWWLSQGMVGRDVRCMFLSFLCCRLRGGRQLYNVAALFKGGEQQKVTEAHLLIVEAIFSPVCNNMLVYLLGLLLKNKSHKNDAVLPSSWKTFQVDSCAVEKFAQCLKRRRSLKEEAEKLGTLLARGNVTFFDLVDFSCRNINDGDKIPDKRPNKFFFPCYRPYKFALKAPDYGHLYDLITICILSELSDKVIKHLLHILLKVHAKKRSGTGLVHLSDIEVAYSWYRLGIEIPDLGEKNPTFWDLIQYLGLNISVEGVPRKCSGLR